MGKRGEEGGKGIRRGRREKDRRDVCGFLNIFFVHNVSATLSSSTE